jgi:hypothetical protein
MPVPLVRATPSPPSMPVVVVVPVGLIPAINPGGGGMPMPDPVVVVGAPVVGVVVLGGVVLVLVPVPAWLKYRKTTIILT